MTCPPTNTELLDPLADLDGEDLACLGLRRANDFMDAFSDLNKQRKEQAWERYAALSKPREPPKPRKPPPLDRLLKQAAKAGKSVKGAEAYADRTVLQFGEPMPVEPDNPWPLNEFRTKETKQ